MFNDGKDHLPEKLPLRNAEDILSKGPLDNDHIMAEVRFGLRGLFLKALYYPNSELVAIGLEYLQLLQKTKSSLANYSVEDKILEEFKNNPSITDQRTLFSEEKEHILSMTRSAELSKIATALLMPTDENIDFCQKAYLHVGWTEEFLKQTIQNNVLEELEKKNLYPPKIKGLDNQIDIKSDLTLKSVPTENVRSLLDQLEEEDVNEDENLSQEVEQPVIKSEKDATEITQEIKQSNPAVFDSYITDDQKANDIVARHLKENQKIDLHDLVDYDDLSDEDKKQVNQLTNNDQLPPFSFMIKEEYKRTSYPELEGPIQMQEKIESIEDNKKEKKDKSMLEKAKDIILNPGLPKWGKQHAVESLESAEEEKEEQTAKEKKKIDELQFENKLEF